MESKSLLMCAILFGAVFQEATAIYWGDPIEWGDIWGEITDTAEAIGDLAKDGWEWLVEGDPHMIQRIDGSIKPIHYSIFGEDGETYQYINDPTKELTISATMKLVNGNQGMYVGEVQIGIKDVQIVIDLDGVTIDGETLDWSELALENTPAAQAYFGDNGVTLTIAPDEVNLYFSSVQLIVRKKEDRNLNILMKTDGSARVARGGILGYMLENAQISNGNLILMDIDETTSQIPVQEEVKFWRVSGTDLKNDQVYIDMLLRNCLSCANP